jgi:hypothetical protein
VGAFFFIKENLLMKDQHKLIKGYRDLSQAEIDAMNAVKAEGSRLGLLIEELRVSSNIDQRWVDIAETHLQQGIMAAVRSIAKPQSF